jgi:hypothetical protein
MSDLRELIDEIKESNSKNNERLGEIERDGRNSRRHLLEMKKTMFRIEDSVRLIAEPPEIDNSLDEEARREQVARDEKLIAAVEKMSGIQSKAAKPDKSGGTSIIGAIGKLFGGAGLGIGAAFLGVAALAGVGVYLANTFQDIDTQKIKDNVKDLLSIGDELNDGDYLATLGQGGTLFLVLGGIGAGLAIFGAGSAAAKAADYFGQEGWTERIKDNVVNLLSISDSLGGKANMLLEGGAFTLTMTGIGLGLAAFSVGAGAASAIDYFGKAGWSQRIKDNVVTLLSISDEVGGKAEMLKEGGTFALAMGGLGLGLAAFALGQGTAVAAGGMATVLETFDGMGWAEAIKQDVMTLLSISQLDGLGWDTTVFIATMGGIAAGLAAFALGKGGNVLVDGADKAISTFTDEPDFAQRIKDQVATLISIAKETDGADTVKFTATMGGLAAGILAFTASDAIGTLADAGQKILGFFGVQSPFQKIMDVADNADKLEKGASALRSIGTSLKDFADIRFDGSSFNIEEFADDLKASVPIIEKAVLGDSGGIFGTAIQGLSNNGLQYEQAARNMAELKAIFDVNGEGGSGGGGNTVINNYYGNNGGTGNTTIIGDDGSPYGRDPNLDGMAIMR